MKSVATVPPSTDTAMSLVRGELSKGRRWAYRLLLVVTTLWVAFIVSIWATEPERLPTRTHVAFGALTFIGIGWIGTFLWILSRRHCPTALDRIATAWMATVASGLFLIVSVTTSLVRSDPSVALSCGVVGVTFVILSVLLLRQSYRRRSELQRLADQMRQ